MVCATRPPLGATRPILSAFMTWSAMFPSSSWLAAISSRTAAGFALRPMALPKLPTVAAGMWLPWGPLGTTTANPRDSRTTSTGTGSLRDQLLTRVVATWSGTAPRGLGFALYEACRKRRNNPKGRFLMDETPPVSAVSMAVRSPKPQLTEYRLFDPTPLRALHTTSPRRTFISRPVRGRPRPARRRRASSVLGSAFGVPNNLVHTGAFKVQLQLPVRTGHPAGERSALASLGSALAGTPHVSEAYRRKGVLPMCRPNRTVGPTVILVLLLVSPLWLLAQPPAITAPVSEDDVCSPQAYARLEGGELLNRRFTCLSDGDWLSLAQYPILFLYFIREWLFGGHREMTKIHQRLLNIEHGLMSRRSTSTAKPALGSRR